MSKTKELIICVISIAALILALTTNIFATSGSTQDINNILRDANNSNFETIGGTSSTSSSSGSASTSGGTTSTLAPTNGTNNNTNNNATKIPYTGVDSFSVIAIVAVCGIIAVYAYKKIRDYSDIK